MRKIYTIEITGHNVNAAIWYANKIGQQFDCELFCKDYQWSQVVVFKVIESQSSFFIHCLDCKIIGERVELAYVPKEKL